MSDKLVAVVWQIAVALLDRMLDAKIDQLKDENVKATARRTEDAVVALLEGPVGKAIAQAVARTVAVRALERWFENRPDATHWG